MAIYHLHVKNISRGDGRSVVAAAAYRAGETLANEAEERLSAFGGRRDVVTSEIRVPPHAPPWMTDRASLWNAVEAAEKRKDARLAKEIEFSLPRELPKATWPAVARAMADAYVAQGFFADVAVHDDGVAHNPHVHILLTTRTLSPAGFGGKIRSADGVQFVTEARALWTKIANKALALAGTSAKIDDRSHAARKLDLEPGQHRGPDPQERQARRHNAKQERDAMTPREPIADQDLPVPDPDGKPIHPSELHQAEDRMLETMHGGEVSHDPSASDLAAARRTIDAQSGREMSDDQALAYRLAPDNMLDWLEAPVDVSPADLAAIEHSENHLDWLDLDTPSPSAPSEDAPWQEPERTRR